MFTLTGRRFWRPEMAPGARNKRTLPTTQSNGPQIRSPRSAHFLPKHSPRKCSLGKQARLQSHKRVFLKSPDLTITFRLVKNPFVGLQASLFSWNSLSRAAFRLKVRRSGWPDLGPIWPGCGQRPLVSGARCHFWAPETAPSLCKHCPRK